MWDWEGKYAEESVIDRLFSNHYSFFKKHALGKDVFLTFRVGIAEAVKSKATVPDTDIVSELVAKGEIELGIVVITQILTTPGVELVGPLPPELRISTVSAGAVSSQTKAPDAARDLIKFLKTPETVKVIRAQGMEPLF
jgi:molybdate transport system substrate-binding protein